MPSEPYLWHPVFVHFTVGLLTAAAAFFIVAAFARNASWRPLVVHAAELNLWIGVAITLVTAALGLLAFNTVPHDDEAAHSAMEVHRNFAVVTLVLFAGAAIVAWLQRKRGSHPSVAFAGLMLVALAALAMTGQRGGDLVFGRGLGVQPHGQLQGDAPAEGAEAGHGHHHHEH